MWVDHVQLTAVLKIKASQCLFLQTTLERLFLATASSTFMVTLLNYS